MSGAARRHRARPGRCRAISRRRRTTRCEAADALYGYAPYLDRVPARAGPDAARVRQSRGRRARSSRAAPCRRRRQRRRRLGRRSRRVRHGGRGAARRSRAGRRPGARSTSPIVPGITAMLAVAARVGAPLGHDFCAISLSDNLKPWELIERRLDAAAAAGFVIALYNPVSRARPWQLGKAFDAAARHLPGATPVIFGRAVGRADERIDGDHARRRRPTRRPTWRRWSSSARARRG